LEEGADVARFARSAGFAAPLRGARSWCFCLKNALGVLVASPLARSARSFNALGLSNARGWKRARTSLASLALPASPPRYAAPALGVFAREKRSGLARLRHSLAPLVRLLSFWSFSKVSQIFLNPFLGSKCRHRRHYWGVKHYVFMVGAYCMATKRGGEPFSDFLMAYIRPFLSPALRPPPVSRTGAASCLQCIKKRPHSADNRG